MAAVAMALPILPGKLESWRRGMDEQTGSRWAAGGAARRRWGVTRERIWLQQTPTGNIEIILLETDDPARMFQEIATSQESFEVWLRQFVLENLGIDLTQTMPGPPPELILDWSADQ
ncbi:MAG: hypothetical protein ACRDJH_00720 [Thermomicrobiales bacterium]